MSDRRRQILEAFRKRLHHYGYDKTTMAEIAGDVGLSVGALYLEFHNKEDILAGLMEETVRELESAFVRIVESDLGPARKLQELLVARIELSDRCCRQGAHSGEVLLAVPDRCSRMRSAKEARYVELLESVVREGTASGELAAESPRSCALLLRDAISAYLPPHSLERPSEEVLERGREMAELLVRGLQPQLLRA